MSRMKKGSMVLFAALAMLAYFGLGQLAWAYDEAATKAIYMDKCTKCHGDTGKGDGKKAKTLKKKPRDYSNKAEMAKFTDQELIDQTLDGKKPMPSYRGKLTDQEIADLITYIRSFAK